MSTTNTNNNPANAAPTVDIATRIANLKSTIAVCNAAANDAQKARIAAERDKINCENNLKALGVDPATAAETLKQMDTDIEAQIAALEGTVPYDTLRKLGRIS